ncbi:MAG TPA: RICIN domain-containing protein [Polyangiaceae bacterium]|nr:RICIN domain-containing protein [Polyangiaceae bacterium]
MCPRIAYLLGVFALSSACKSTPLDLVYAVDSGDAASDAAATGGGAGTGGTGAGGAAADAGPCSIVGAGQYVLRSRDSGRCLGQGMPTSVFGNPGFLLDFSLDCRRPERSWQLSTTNTPNVYTIQNLSPPPPPLPGFVLDVQMAGTRDGTPVITYGQTGFDNQRFEVRARDTFGSELRPQHHPQSCVSATADSAQITGCDPTDSTQAWILQLSDCM